MLVYNGICAYIVPSTGELALYSIDTIALSTTEADYMAITEAMEEAIWLQ